MILGFRDKNGSPYLVQITRFSDSQPKREPGRIVDIAPSSWSQDETERKGKES